MLCRESYFITNASLDAPYSAVMWYLMRSGSVYGKSRVQWNQQLTIPAKPVASGTGAPIILRVEATQPTPAAKPCPVCSAMRTARSSAIVRPERVGLTASDVRAGERDLEGSVSHYIGDLPVLFVAAEDEAGPSSIRGIIERNSIALLSNYHREVIDAASPAWLGRYSGRERVRESGLWNNNHVDKAYDPRYLEILERAVSATGPIT